MIMFTLSPLILQDSTLILHGLVLILEDTDLVISISQSHNGDSMFRELRFYGTELCLKWLPCKFEKEFKSLDI